MHETRRAKLLDMFLQGTNWRSWGYLLPKNVDGFDEFEVVLRRAWEIQNNEPQRAERKMRLANDSPQAANQSCRDPDEGKHAGPGPVSFVPDAQRRPKRES